MREAEQLAAAAVVGVKEVVLREPDGSVVNTLELRKKLVREIPAFARGGDLQRPDGFLCGQHLYQPP